MAGITAETLAAAAVNKPAPAPAGPAAEFLPLNEKPANTAAVAADAAGDMLAVPCKPLKDGNTGLPTLAPVADPASDAPKANLVGDLVVIDTGVEADGIASPTDELLTGMSDPPNLNDATVVAVVAVAAAVRVTPAAGAANLLEARAAAVAAAAAISFPG